MKIVLILALGITAIYIGIGIGTIMRFDRKLSRQSVIIIMIIVPIFVAYGFIIWTNELRKDLGKMNRVKLSYIRYIYKAFMKEMPSMCESCASMIIDIRKKNLEQQSEVQKTTSKRYEKKVNHVSYRLECRIPQPSKIKKARLEKCSKRVKKAHQRNNMIRGCIGIVKSI